MKTDTIPKIIFALAALLVIGGIVYAGGAHIRGELIVDEINNIQYVLAGNSTDIATKISGCGHNCKIILPCGLYTWNENITLQENQSLIGSGYCTRLNRTAAEPSITAEVGANNIRISRINIVNNGYDSVPIWLANHSNYWDTGYHSNVEIDNIYSDGENCATKFLSLWALSAKIHDNTIIGYKSGIGLLDDANNPTRNHDVMIYNNFLNSTGTYTSESEGIELNVHNTEGRAIVSNNYVLNFGEQGIDFNAASGVVSDNHIKMKSLYKSSMGIHVRRQGGNGVRQVTITGNTIENTPYRGINLWDVNGGAVVGNTIVGNMSADGIGIYIYNENTDNLNIQGNSIRNYTYGIYSNSTGKNINIFPNSFKNCTNSIYFGPAGGDFNTIVSFHNMNIKNLSTIKEPSMQGLMGAYSSNTESVNTSHALDSSPNYNDLRPTGTVVHNRHVGYGDSGAYILDRAGELRGTALNIFNQSNNYSILMVVKNQNWSNVNVWLQNTDSRDERVVIQSDASGRFIYGLYQGAAWVHKRSAQTYADDSWHYLAVTHNGGSDYNFYVDFKNATGTAQGSSAADVYFHLGSRTSQTNRAQGIIDNVWVFNRTLSIDDIKAFFEQRIEPRTPVTYRK